MAQEINGLLEISSKYQVFLVDLWGVVHNGVKVYPGVNEILLQLEQEGRTIIFVSNAPRPGNLTAQHLRTLGISLQEVRIVTSGDYTQHILKTQFPHAKIFHLGADRNKDILQGLPHQKVDTPEECDVVLLTAFIEEHEPITKHDELLKRIAKLQKPVLCANPDLKAMHGSSYRYTAGTFGKRLEEMGLQPRYLGKPDVGIYNFAADMYGFQQTPKGTILMIGDTLETDIAGATNFGIHSLLVGTGNFFPHTTEHIAHPLKGFTYYVKTLSNP